MYFNHGIIYILKYIKNEMYLIVGINIWNLCIIVDEKISSVLFMSKLR